jgi:RNA polymerase sigma-70 factor (ECF subfamily)
MENGHMNFTPSEIRTIVRTITKQTGTPLHDEDLEQDVAVRALEAFGRIQAIHHPRAFLAKIVRDAVRDHWRRRRRSENIDAVDPRLMSESPAFEEVIDRTRRTHRLREAVQLLCTRKRDLLELFYKEDLSVSEIASIQGRTASAVKMDLFRARRELARILHGMSAKNRWKSRATGE